MHPAQLRKAGTGVALAVSASLLFAPMLPAQGLGIAGSYLAARQAVVDGDHREAATYFEQALRADPDNVTLMSNAVLARAALGDWAAALETAAQIPTDIPGRELANIVEQVERVRNGERAGALTAIDEQRGAGPLIDELARAWLTFGEGDLSEAEAILTEIAADGPLSDIARYHLALLRAAVGDFEGAHAIFSGEEYGPLNASVRGLNAHAQVLVQLGRADDALEMLDQATARIPDPSLIGLRDDLAENPERPYDFVISAEQGVAEGFFTIARGLGSESGGPLALIYAHAAHLLEPRLTDAVLIAAELLEEAGQLQLAAETYRSVPPGDPLFVTAELGRANALFDAGREDAAIEVMELLARDHPTSANVHASLGDLHRRVENWEGAIEAYSRALNLVDTEQARYWFVYYTRGIAYEQSDQWDLAEPDFRRALELNPEQPQVLNYLGYSLVEQRRSFDEALDMIERAVAARPDSGYIVDSLGWVLYRLGRFEEAVEPMERAVELLPTDPIINDHLGDVYWKVGREREAEFQWLRALSFEPEEEDAERIRLKLEIGLDAVLEQEGGVGAAE